MRLVDATPHGRPTPPEERLGATAATVTASILGGAHIVDVHDVVEMGTSLGLATA